MAKAVQLKDKAGNKVYAAPYFPIGSIYLTVGSYNPSTYFGGKWEKISGGYLWGCNSSIDNNLMDSSVGHTKSFDTILTIDQIPSHKHTVNKAWGRDIGGSGWGAIIQQYSSGYVFSPSSINDQMSNTGGGKGHSHDIPHIGVRVWKRIA